MTTHLVYLKESLTASRGQSNWLVIEICGLILGDFYRESNEQLEEALSILEIALALQIEADGI